MTLIYSNFMKLRVTYFLTSTQVDTKDSKTPVKSTEDCNAEVPNEGETVNKGTTIKRTVESIPSKFVCCSCDNKCDMCHQYKFCTYLAHKAISFSEQNKPDEVTES